MKVLLDTSVLAWLLLGSKHHISSRARKALDTARDGRAVSAASCWEIATKVRLGKWRELESLEHNLPGGIHALGLEIVPIDGEAALRAGRFSAPHKDPFDRMIAAVALREECVLLSPDRLLDQFDVVRVW